MAKDDPQTLTERLFTTFLGPLVVGGEVRPGKLFGGKGALSIGEGRAPSDVDLLSRSELARVRIARKIAPVDTFERAPTRHEWALAALLHDLVQSTHPGFDAAFRRSGPRRVLDVIERTLERIPAPATVGDALSRHTWLSRMFELTRTDVDVKWRTGSERFLGSDPPPRLTLWPKLRRVTQTRTPHPLMDLPTSGSAVDPARFAEVTEKLLTKTPLTDVATLTRASPAFAWTRENLSLGATHAGRTMILRALGLLPARGVDAALGRATKQLFAAKATRALVVAVDLLRDRALMIAAERLSRGERDALGSDPGDAAFAVGAGALVATHWIGTTGGGLREADRGALLELLAPAAKSAAAKEVESMLAAANEAPPRTSTCPACS